MVTRKNTEDIDTKRTPLIKGVLYYFLLNKKYYSLV